MKIGIVGCGSIGARHRDNARKLGHETIVYDPTIPSDVKFEREVYDKADAVVISTPSMFHEGPLRACIERGKHALVEKPISTSLGALPLLLDAAEAKGLVVMMGNNLRLHPCVAQTKRWIDQNQFGNPIWANFICATEPSITADRDGAILNTGAHEVDVALHLFGPAQVVRACAYGSTPNSNERIADFVLAHSSITSSFHIDLITPHRVRKYTIAFEQKTLECDLDRRRFAYDERFVGYHYRDSYDDDYVDEMRAFLGLVSGEESAKRLPVATGRDGLETLKVLLNIKEKAGCV